MSDTSDAAGVTGGRRELRLGLVCYGGVSLAIYMHGVTKELHRALRASVLAEHGLEPAAASRSEAVYRELLTELAGEHGALTRIVVDTIAGSSAGGINGIFLAKALAHDLSQDKLRDLWFEHGDLPRIVRRPDLPGPDVVYTEPAEQVLKLILPGSNGVPSAETWTDIAFAVLGVARGAPSLFNGQEMSQRIYEALHGMEPSSPALDSLMPDGHPVELAVTVTDFGGYRRELPLTEPRVLAESQHRHLLEFRYGEGRDDFDSTHDDALTLAARATSSLPLGFEPVNPGTFPQTIPAGSTPADLEPYFRSYRLSDADPDRAYLVDGGVLDNKPFAPVIKAIRARPAATEVERYLLFLEPDPHPPRRGARPVDEPHPLSLILGALSGLPRSEPILDELHGVVLKNRHVRAVRDVIETNWQAVADLAREAVPEIDTPPADPSLEQMRTWNQRVHELAESLTRLGQPAYVRLKISSTIESFGRAANLVCDYTDASNQAYLVHEVLRAWARRRGLFKQEVETRDGITQWTPTEAQREFVATFDLAFAERRLRFVIAGVNWLYRDLGKPGVPSREELDAVKRRLYRAVSELEGLSTGRGFSDAVRTDIRSCFEEKLVGDYLREHQFDIAAFLRDYSPRLDKLAATLKTFLDEERPKIAPDLYRDLVRMTADWEGKPRGDLLVRYLGFPIWDALLYPTQALSDVAEGDELRVLRLSPIDSDALEPPQGTSKIEGAKLGHAFAFFSREARENDYLWGRLDAAERMVRLLLTTYVVEEDEDGAPVRRRVSGREHPRYTAWCARAFRAVLEEDEPALQSIPDIVQELRRKVDALV